ncbi:glycerol-3-phosphate acyltransferase [Lysinibacillus sp. MHQ-1]|nr:glycerol-3-phosphate acyltransferase [Lysinibacillus sp. MHQ-1]
MIGCIHGSKVAQFLSGVDLKKAGHGNAGASNATLSLGWKYGVLVALIDIGKRRRSHRRCTFLFSRCNTFNSRTNMAPHLLDSCRGYFGA